MAEKEAKPFDAASKSVDPVTVEMLKKAQAEGIETIFVRAEKMKPCPIGAEGSCCKICSQGPCRVPKPKKEGEETKGRMGLCGATAETISARNFARMVAAGSASHNDHSRGVALLFKEVAHGKAQGYQIKDVAKLKRVAKDWDVAITEGEGDDKKARTPEAIAQEMADKVLKMFGQQEGELNYIKRAPKKRQEIWRAEGVVPRGCDIEIVELMHRTHMGVDQEYHNIIKQCTRTALSDGWGGSMISTDLQDIMFGMPVPVAGEINLGVLKEDHVNIIIHGHEPLLPEMIYVASQEPEIDPVCPEQGRQGHPVGRDVLQRQRDSDAPRPAHCRQLPAAGTGHDHRRGGCHGSGRAVRNAVPGQHRQVLPHQADHHG